MGRTFRTTLFALVVAAAAGGCGDPAPDAHALDAAAPMEVNAFCDAARENVPLPRSQRRAADGAARSQYADLVSSAAAEPWIPPASKVSIRVHADALKMLARRHGISQLRLASDGRLVGNVAEDRDALDVMDFELEAVRLLGAEVRLYSDRVLDKDNVSPELVAAQPL